MLAEDRTQRRLRELTGRIDEALDLDDGALRIDHAEVDHRIDVHGDVVARNHILGRHVENDGSQADAGDRLDEGEDQDQTRTFDAGEAAEREDDRTLVFTQDADRAREKCEDDTDYEDHEERSACHRILPSVSVGESRLEPPGTITRPIRPLAPPHAGPRHWITIHLPVSLSARYHEILSARSQKHPRSRTSARRVLRRGGAWRPEAARAPTRDGGCRASSLPGSTARLDRRSGVLPGIRRRHQRGERPDETPCGRPSCEPPRGRGAGS